MSKTNKQLRALVECGKKRLIMNVAYTYAHLPELAMHYGNPPGEITKDKYTDVVYLKYVKNQIEKLNDTHFETTRFDGVLPYSKEVILGHINALLQYLENTESEQP